MNKLKFILTASIAAALTLSCTGDPEDDSGSSSSVGNESSSSSGTQVGSNVNPSSSSGGVNQPSEGNSSSSNGSQSGGGNSSSSSGGGNPSNGDQNTVVYTLASKTADQFTYIEVYEDERCREGGVLEIEKDTDENTVNYSINNNVMVWKYSWGKDTLNFKGTSNELIGAWTRAKNKDTSCKEEIERWCRVYDEGECIEYEEETYFSCKYGYDITKAVFTETTVSITRDICYTDRLFGKEVKNGWEWRTVDCNTAELYKGSDKITLKIKVAIDEVSYSYTYKGESCNYNPSKSQKEAACKEAWDTYHNDEYYWTDYYYEILEREPENCLKRILPAELFEDDESDSYGKVAAKPVAKAKAKAQFMPLLKKIN